MTAKRCRSESPSSPSEYSSIRDATPDPKILSMDPPSATPTAVQCTLAPHAPINFPTIQAYEAHFTKEHTHRCTECGKNFPDDHWLQLHITENHDPFFAAKRDGAEEKNEKVWGCFVVGCDKKCRDERKRRWHCFAKHQFPQDFDFFIVNEGVDGRTSMLRPTRGIQSPRRRRESTASTTSSGRASGRRTSWTTSSTKPEEVAAPVRTPYNRSHIGNFVPPPRERPADEKMDIDALASSMDALKFVPHSVQEAARRKANEKAQLESQG